MGTALPTPVSCLVSPLIRLPRRLSDDVARELYIEESYASSEDYGPIPVVSALAAMAMHPYLRVSNLRLSAPSRATMSVTQAHRGPPPELTSTAPRRCVPAKPCALAGAPLRPRFATHTADACSPPPSFDHCRCHPAQPCPPLVLTIVLESSLLDLPTQVRSGGSSSSIPPNPVTRGLPLGIYRNPKGWLSRYKGLHALHLPKMLEYATGSEAFISFL